MFSLQTNCMEFEILAACCGYLNLQLNYVVVITRSDLNGNYFQILSF